MLVVQGDGAKCTKVIRKEGKGWRWTIVCEWQHDKNIKE